ncbi:hypothetical protein PIB30_029073 [Stylosanthes scabra]|uniref:Uncharacterized protein n=1 Tax=Stylosanthes scabra TaxID=79078 RepID=A0ABU6SB77_9FABA|nr:hypothetical protein [Stylosanthes scabra]
MAITPDNCSSSFPVCELPYYKMVEHVIDVRSVLEDLKLSDCSIYNVPSNLRKVNREAYTPEMISVGPIHFGKPELKPMQEHKLRYFGFFWNRISNGRAMNEYKEFLGKEEQRIRQSYARKFPEIKKEQFVEMMLLDSVFIMELFLRSIICYWKLGRSTPQKHSHVTKSFKKKNSDDYIMTQSWVNRNIARDLILLENQIPFFLLDWLYNHVVVNERNEEIKNQYNCFVELAICYFAFYDIQMSSCDETKTLVERNQSDERNNNLNGSSHGSTRKPNKPINSNLPEHFTDLIRCFYLPHKEVPYRNGYPFLRTATKLQDSGITFEKVVNRRLLDITFEKKPILSSLLCFSCLPLTEVFKARFRIPQLRVDYTTECVLRNLIAFEQCHYPEKPYICNYVSLIDSLIHTKMDAELLVEKEVIVHELGSDEEVATLVNGLCRHVVTHTTCYHDVINDLNKHYQNPWNRTMAALWLVYFRDTWRASSTVVGIAVLIFAVFNFLRALNYFVYGK